MRNHFLLGGLLLAACSLALVPNTSHAQSLDAKVTGQTHWFGGYPAQEGWYCPKNVARYNPYQIDVDAVLTGVPPYFNTSVFTGGIAGISKTEILSTEVIYDFGGVADPVIVGYQVKGDKVTNPFTLSATYTTSNGSSYTVTYQDFPSQNSETFDVVNEDQGYYRWMGKVFADRMGGLPVEAPQFAFTTDSDYGYNNIAWATADYHSP